MLFSYFIWHKPLHFITFMRFSFIYVTFSSLDMSQEKLWLCCRIGNLRQIPLMSINRRRPPPKRTKFECGFNWLTVIYMIYTFIYHWSYEFIFGLVFVFWRQSRNLHISKMAATKTEWQNQDFILFDEYAHMIHVFM